MLAAKSGNIDTAELLVSNGAAIQAQDSNNCSALFYACSGGHLQMVKFLITNNLEGFIANKWWKFGGPGYDLFSIPLPV